MHDDALAKLGGGFVASGGEIGGSRQPDHIIAPDEVDDWLADSVVKTATYHRTMPWDAEDIIKHGVDPQRSRSGAYGQGFYTSTAREEYRGTAEVVVAIRTRTPLLGSIGEVERVIDDIVSRVRPRDRGLTPAGAAAVRLELLQLGYDGILIRDAGGDGVDWVVAISPATTKVVLAP